MLFFQSSQRKNSELSSKRNLSSFYSLACENERLHQRNWNCSSPFTKANPPRPPHPEPLEKAQGRGAAAWCSSQDTSGNVCLGASLPTLPRFRTVRQRPNRGNGHTNRPAQLRACTVQKGGILVCWDHRSTAGLLIHWLAFQYPECFYHSLDSEALNSGS